MNIKSLLLGSAAAMVVTSGAQAADPVVVEAEPVEYVRVCDAYGSGFFYIPGTETCISFSGFVRSSYEKVYLETDGIHLDTGIIGTPNATTTAIVGPPFTGERDVSFTFWGQRARLNVDTRNETDWGTLRAQYRLEGGSSNTDADIDMDRALISLAGFRFGFTDNYWSTNHGYGWINAEGLGNAASGITIEDGFYGFDDATIADYTWSSDGLSVTIGVEDTRISYGRDSGFGDGGSNDGGNDGRANFYAGFNYSGEGWGLAFTAIHDSFAPEVNALGVTTDIGGWAYKVSANVDLSSIAPGGMLWAMYAADGDYNTDYVHSNFLTENPDSIWGVAYGMDLTDEVQFWANYWNIDGGNACTVGGPSGTVAGVCSALGAAITEGDTTQWGVGLNWYPAAAPGFHVKTSYYMGESDSSASSGAGILGSSAAGLDLDYSGWNITVRRDF